MIAIIELIIGEGIEPFLRHFNFFSSLVESVSEKMSFDSFLTPAQEANLKLFLSAINRINVLLVQPRDAERKQSHVRNLLKHFLSPSYYQVKVVSILNSPVMQTKQLIRFHNHQNVNAIQSHV